MTALLGGLLLLTALENGGTLSIPWLFSPEVTLVTQAQGLVGFAVLGALWSAALLLPTLLVLRAERGRAERLLAERERHLETLLRAQFVSREGEVPEQAREKEGTP